MPGVTVLPPSPAFPTAFGHLPTKMQNGLSPNVRETITDIKASAREQARKASRGASATSLLQTARHQILIAKTYESEGELKAALASFTKAATLAQMVIESSELKQQGTKGELTKEFLNFSQGEGRDLAIRAQNIETKLIEMEASTSTSRDVDEAPLKSGGGIADRVRALQSAGLSVATSKRISREIPSSASPTSPDLSFHKPNRISLHGLPSPILPSGLASPVATSSVSPSPHTLVPASSFGPPSPTSSASSSPHHSHLSLSEFAQTFPSIDELEEANGLHLPSIPTGTSTGSRSSKHSISPHRAEGPPIYAPKAFPVLPLDPGPRPSSTPIPPTIDTFVSRPGSPATRSPLSPTVPRKPSALGLNKQTSRSPLIPSGSITPNMEKRELSFTSLFPKTLHECMNKQNFKVLVIDVRTREEFEKEHLKADAIVCIEPSVLLRERVTGDTISDALVVAPRHESMLFKNRDKFDLIAVYDEATENQANSVAITSLMKAIYELSFKIILRNVPMLLIGGLAAWKAEFPDELIRGGSTTPNGLGINGVSYGSPPLHPLPSPMQPRPVVPIIVGHSRTPAESSASALFSPTIPDAVTMGRNRSGTETGDAANDANGYRLWHPTNGASSQPALDQLPLSPRLGMGDNYPIPSPPQDPSKRLIRKPAMSRPASNSVSYSQSPLPDHASSHRSSPSLANAATITYPQFNRTISPQVSGSSFSPSSRANGPLSLPPQASINPSPLSRRRSDYVDQSQEALSGLSSRPPIDYPDLSSQHILRPPPIAASSTMERQDNRPRILQQSHPPAPINGHRPQPPTIQSDYPVTYWADVQIGTSGLKNLGNTCYMNSTIQCLSATVPFARFFTDGRWKSAVNMVNPLGSKGNLAHAFASILRDMWQGEMQWISPTTFRRSICTYASQFAGSEQHDSQEFLSFLLDGLHEDLNRVLQKPNIEDNPSREAELERLPTQIASEQEWQIYRMRNDSLIVDFFQGQFRNRLECLTCRKTSTTYNTFMYLTLPVPTGKHISKVSLQHCLDAFVKEEVMEKSDAWNCPNCKALRKATKHLSISRLPPVLLIHLKRFSVKGPFTDKIETCVDFPLRGLDLTNYMPPPLPPGAGGVPSVSRDDPRAQVPPYRYDLYGVTNHYGSLSSGHYTAFISSRGGWLYCDDSKISPADPKDVVGKAAYILFYKRTKA
ncbi:hypothetical protein ABKN59_006688 [Abortiporus biennis]